MVVRTVVNLEGVVSDNQGTKGKDRFPSVGLCWISHHKQVKG